MPVRTAVTGVLAANGEHTIMRQPFLDVPDDVVVLPYDPQLDQVVLAQQFQVGPVVLGEGQASFALPEGPLMVQGENPETAAFFILRQKIGLYFSKAEQIVPPQIRDPKSGPSKVSFYCARVDLTQALPRRIVLDGCAITPVKMMRSTFHKMVDDGEIQGLGAYIANDWLCRNAMTFALRGKPVRTK